MTQAPRLAASERRAQLLAIAVDLAGRYGLNAVTRELLASSAKVSPSLVTLYWPLRGARELETPGLRDAIVSEAVRMGMPALAVTDHGAMFGALRFYETARAAGITPIIGVTAIRYQSHPIHAAGYRLRYRHPSPVINANASPAPPICHHACHTGGE